MKTKCKQQCQSVSGCTEITPKKKEIKKFTISDSTWAQVINGRNKIFTSPFFNSERHVYFASKPARILVIVSYMNYSNVPSLVYHLRESFIDDEFTRKYFCSLFVYVYVFEIASDQFAWELFIF